MTIKRLRRKKGLSQAALAEKVGIHRVHLANIEDQRRLPSLPTLEKLAKALGVPVTELLT